MRPLNFRSQDDSAIEAIMEEIPSTADQIGATFEGGRHGRRIAMLD